MKITVIVQSGLIKIKMVAVTAVARMS